MHGGVSARARARLELFVCEELDRVKGQVAQQEGPVARKHAARALAREHRAHGDERGLELAC